MRVVIDANIVAAALVRPNGWTAKELARPDVGWFAPEALFEEIEANAAKLSGSAGCSRDALLHRLKKLVHVRRVAAGDLLQSGGDPLLLRAARVDPDDVPYLEAVVATSARYLWTRDHRLLEAFPDLAVLIVPRADRSV